jgi:hypothetical protein
MMLADQLAALQDTRSRLLQQLAQLRPFRAGSISVLVRRCGKPHCRCAQPDDPGHGPNLRLTYKLGGKTITESLPDALALGRVEREIAEFRKFEALMREFVEVNRSMCLLRAERSIPNTRLSASGLPYSTARRGSRARATGRSSRPTTA